MLVTAPYQKRSHHVNVVSRLLSYFYTIDLVQGMEPSA